MVIFVFWFVIICLMVAAGIVFRVARRQLPPVKIHKVAPKAASQLVSEFIASSYDGQFGYPTGLFRVERASESEVVAQEIVGRGSHFTEILKGMYVAVLAIGDSLGCIGGIIALVIAIFLTPALIYAALAEVLLKYLLRSQIVTSLQPAGDATTVAFTLRGPVAMLVGRRLERAFHAPVLPARVAALTGIAVPGLGGPEAAHPAVAEASAPEASAPEASVPGAESAGQDADGPQAAGSGDLAADGGEGQVAADVLPDQGPAS